jgi:3-phenylpropionate/trans-cinnamate dioxygenase ferredoxin component
MAFVSVAALSDVPPGGVLGVETQGARICLVNVEGEVYAFRDNCTHQDFPLSEGELDTDDCTITCEWHGAKFDVRTGEAKGLPATRPVAVYGVRVEGQEILVDIPS